MNRSNSLIAVVGLILFFGLITGLVWGSYQLAEGKTGGEGFLVQWVGLRGLITDGNSPYSASTAAQIQETIRNQSSIFGGISYRYISPLYSGVILFPFALIKNLVLARALWLTTQLLALFGILLIGLKITVWKPAWYIFLIFSLLTIFSIHVVVPWLDGGLSIWAAFFLIMGFLAIRNQWNEVGGIFLALAAIQPQMTILVIIFSLVWGLSKRNKMLIIWFLMTLTSLSILAYFLVPGWIVGYIKLVYNYLVNFPLGNPGVLFRDLWPGLGKELGWMVIGLSVIILIVEWYLAMKKDFRWYLWTACLTIVVSQWIILSTNPGHIVGLILPLILISAMFTERWPRGGQWMAVLITAVLFIWEWILFTKYIIHPQLGIPLSIFIPFPLILFIGLYWVRWWAIRPKRLLIEEQWLGEIY